MKNQPTHPGSMPLAKVRILALLVCAAFFTPVLSDKANFPFFLGHLFMVLPLWNKIDIDRIRNNPFWKVFPLIAMALTYASWQSTVERESTIFILILCCLLYEYYGERRRHAPARLVGLLSFLVVLSQFRYENGLWLALGGLIYAVGLVFCFLNFYLDDLEVSLIKLVRLRLPATILHAAAVTSTTLMLFWIMPRSDSHSFTMTPSNRGTSLRAFSDRVSLNDIGSLKLSKRHVMDVVPLNGNQLHSRYLKGNVLNIYEDGIWESSIGSEQQLRFNRSGHFPVHPLKDPHRTIEYEINIKPLVGNTIFYFDHLLHIEGDLLALFVSTNQSRIYSDRLIPNALNYRIACFPGHVPNWRRQNPMQYLQLPANRAFLRTFIEQAGGPSASDTGQFINQVLDYFVSNYRYTLDINNFGVDDPLEDFLLNRREGHCELFASSMVLLLREMGIPARLVTGFLVPEKHPTADFYHITESSAHAWVEAHYDGYWHTIDPTPPAVFVHPNFVDNQMALLNRLWNKYVLNWDQDTQDDMIQAIYAFMAAIPNQVARFWNQSMRTASLTLLALLSVSLITLFYMRSRWMQPVRVHRRLYRSIKGALAVNHRPKQGWETWRQYLAKAPLDHRVGRHVMAFIERLNRVSFGSLAELSNGQREGAATLRKLRQEARAIKRSIRRQKKKKTGRVQ